MRSLFVAAMLCITACSSGPVCDYGSFYDAGTSWDWDGATNEWFPDSAWGDGGASVIHPAFLPTENAKQAPPAISGGTLLVTRDGRFAIASDPERDAVYVVDMTSLTVASTITLAAGDEPGRLVEDGARLVHVALRGGGALFTFDPVTGAVIARRAVCPAPRGVAWDEATDSVWVACATGELVALPTHGGPATRSLVIERDLRDVIASPEGLSISTFRSANVLRLDASASVTRRDTIPQTPEMQQRAAHVAWRMAAAPNGSVVLAHQLESTTSVSTLSNGYGGCGQGMSSDMNFASKPCEEQPGAVVSALTIMTSAGNVAVSRMFPASLPVDVAASRDGQRYAVVAAGDSFVNGLDSVFWFDTKGNVVTTARVASAHIRENTTPIRQPIAIAFGADHGVVVQTREPAELWLFDDHGGEKAHVSLSSVSRRDTGHEIFHTQAGSMIACASCHPEGGDDGHTWLLDGEGRRTPSLRGTIANTAPYHWRGDEDTLDALVADVYTTRMSGQHLAPNQASALESYASSLPRPAAPSWVDTASALRGRALFEKPEIGCASCHAGSRLTDNLTVDVGTGGAFQVPPLVGVGWRTPLLHDGCAAQIADRFGNKCATAGHGNIGSLSSSDITDLVSFLDSL
jgi:DNA-binding beta-propeller fold protein YncE/mono/diheme cytochrome c family protein